jgi:hypothetical protein
MAKKKVASVEVDTVVNNFCASNAAFRLLKKSKKTLGRKS